MTIVNLTPHTVNILDVESQTHTIPTLLFDDKFVIARRETTSVTETLTTENLQFSVAEVRFGEPHLGFFNSPNDKVPHSTIGLNENESLPFNKGDVLVVSRIFLDAPGVREWARKLGVNIFSPGEMIRGEDGKVVKAKGFSK